MIRILHKLLVFCDKKNARRIRFAYVFSFLNAFAQNAPIMAGIFMIRALMDGTADVKICCLTAGILLLCFALGTFFRHMSDRLQSSAGYKVFAEKRIEFAKHLRKLPMGYFTDENIGRISSILTEDMVFVEENSMSVLAEIASGIFAQIVVTSFMFFLDPVLGGIALFTDIVILILSIPMNKAAELGTVLSFHEEDPQYITNNGIIFYYYANYCYTSFHCFVLSFSFYCHAELVSASYPL